MENDITTFPHDNSAFMRNMGEPIMMNVAGQQVEIDALFSLNCVEEFLAFVDSGNDYKMAVAKLAYSRYKDSNCDEMGLSESDFIFLSESELANFAAVLYRQVIDAEKESEIYTGNDIFREVYEKSNGLRMEMAETARKFIAPFLKTQNHLSKMQKSFDVASRVDNIISNFGTGNISSVLGITNNINFQHSNLYSSSHDMGALSSTIVKTFDTQFVATKMVLPQINAINNITSGLQEFATISSQYNQFVSTMISPGVVSALQEAASRIEKIINPLGNVIASISENFFNPLRELWAAIDFDEMHRSLLEKERKGIEQILFETKWFMFSTDIAVGSFVLDVVKVLKNKRIKNHNKHIDNIVFKHITYEIVDDIKRDWKSHKLSKHIKRVLHESINTYKRREYASTVAVLSSLWQGLIYDLCDNAESRKDKKTKEQFADIIKREEAPVITSQFLNEYIWKDCHSSDGVIDGIPGRHAIAHGWFMETKYPSRKEALNAILFTHFLISFYAYEDEFAHEKYK